jgi:signal transduction histidine kinase
MRIKRQVSDDDRIEYSSVIVSETKRLQSLSGKLMELLSVGNIDLAVEVTDFAELAEELSLTLQPIFEKHGIHFEYQIDCQPILADRELIKSLLYNLIDNSIKASRPGSTIWLEGRQTATMLTVSVRDQGLGIPADQIPMLIEPFYMVDKARTRKAGGAGLGLAICTEIAHAHGADLSIESELGKGTTINVSFPLAAPEKPRQASAAGTEAVVADAQ